jgi:glycosyltransferase involved in cell wall biosynthesis
LCVNAKWDWPQPRGLCRILKLHGGNPKTALRKGTHNRALYRKILAAEGWVPDAEPLVSLVVRVKYAPDRIAAFLLSIQRQRYDNWEIVFVTDGPNTAAKLLVERANDPRVKLIVTEKALGRWGHPHRQRGIDACSGEFIGLSNDDNYYVSGYIEQMMNALEDQNADLALCGMLHSYWRWGQIEPGHDLGSWIARRALLRSTPWTGDDFFYDARYLAELRKNAGEKTVIVNRPLFIHN